MGICGAKDEMVDLDQANHNSIDVKLAAEAREDRNTCKILMLGPFADLRRFTEYLGTGESGKSTIFKQLQLLYTQGSLLFAKCGDSGIVGFTSSEVKDSKTAIRRNVLECMHALLRLSDDEYMITMIHIISPFIPLTQASRFPHFKTLDSVESGELKENDVALKFVRKV